MPSVIVSWSGSCRDHSVCGDLCDRLEVIAKTAQNFFEERPAIKRMNQRIGGNVLLSSDLLDEETWDEVIAGEKVAGTSAGLLPLANAEDLQQREAPSLVHILRPPEVASIFSLDQASLFGIEFRLQNIYYRDENRISFVFLRNPNPGLDGIVAQVEGKDRCKQYESEIIQKADWFLRKPEIHLRYHCEEWVDFLFGWVKHFYISDLSYWRYEWLPGYDLFSKIDPKDVRQRDDLFRLLKESLIMESSAWPGMKTTEDMSFWDKLAILKKKIERRR